MIFDKLKNWQCYPFGPVWERAIKFLLSLNADAEEKRYELQGEDIFAIVASYETKLPESACFETHQKYIDIQTVLSGNEIIATALQDGLTVRTPYDKGKDVAFYEHTGSMDSTYMRPGTFALFYPHDAHMPGLMAKEKAEMVKKCVVKINVDLLYNK